MSEVTGNESSDGRVGADYLRPASRRKGKRLLPGWRDPDWAKQNWRDCRRYARRYAIFVVLAFVAAAWHLGGLLGYWEGYADGRANRTPAPQRQESR